MDPVPGVLFAQKEPRSNRRRGFRLLSPGDDSGQAPGEGGNPGPGELPEIHRSVAMGGFDRQGERVSIALWCSQLIVMWTLYGPEHEKAPTRTCFQARDRGIWCAIRDSNPEPAD